MVRAMQSFDHWFLVFVCDLVLVIWPFLFMPDLIAQGPQPEQRWRRKLIPGQRQTIGRERATGPCPGTIAFRDEHVEIEFRDGRLRVGEIRGGQETRSSMRARTRRCFA